jgi:hypothetical protein
MALGLVGVGLGARAVEHRHGALADHLHRAIRVHDRARVLVETDAEQGRRLSDDGQKSPEPPALLEVLIDHHAVQHAEPGRELRHPLLRGLPRAAERHHVRGHRARPRRCPREDGPSVVCPVDRVGEPGPGDDRGETELLPPVRKTAVASLRVAAAPGSSASDRSSGRRPVTRPMPRSPNSSRYRSVATSPSDEAVAMTTT